MNRDQFRKAAVLLVLLVFLLVSISASFTLATRAACCIEEYGSLCQNLAVLQENLRRFAGVLLAAAGALAILFLLQMTAGRLSTKRSPISLISLKARLNN